MSSGRQYFWLLLQVDGPAMVLDQSGQLVAATDDRMQLDRQPYSRVVGIFKSDDEASAAGAEIFHRVPAFTYITVKRRLGVADIGK